MSSIVPFGKYRGQPVEAMAGDRQYTDWLLQQEWFREKHDALYAIVINNFGEPSETPEHNLMQARFLDDHFCMALARIVFPEAGISGVSGIAFEHKGFDVSMHVMRRGEDCDWSESLLVECKPVLSDDYPAVLRQIKRTERNNHTRIALVVGSYAGAVPWSSVCSIFALDRISVVLTGDIQNNIRMCPDTKP